MIRKNKELLKSLYNCGIIEKKHCILRSGKHSDEYIKKTKITLYPSLFPYIIHYLHDEITFQYKREEYDIITGPAVAGICFAAPVAFLLRKPFIFPEKVSKIVSDDINNLITVEIKKSFMEFREEYQNSLKRSKVIIIEDIITTGGSVEKTAYSIFKYGGIPIAVFCLWNRDPNIQYIVLKNRINYKIPIYSLINEPINSWNANECYCNK